MGKHLTLIFLSLILFSCASRKVAINKSSSEVSVDSTIVEKKDSVAVTQNAINIKEEIDEIEVTPIDTAKPIIIGDKKYFNAIVRLKKTKRNTLDTSKTIVAQTVEKAVKIKRKESKKVFVKDKKVTPVNWWLLWLLLIPVAFWIYRKLKPMWL